MQGTTSILVCNGTASILVRNGNLAFNFVGCSWGEGQREKPRRA